MEPEINCSEFCDNFPGQELDRRPFQDLCRTTVTSSDSSQTISPVSPVLLGIIWTFLSSGLLLILFFLAFTIRCRKNRIVKMSSPNLNIVTLLGSCLTYSSAYLFGIQNQDVLVGSSIETVIQVRLSLLCIGTSLVFGPILGKSWRLYKVFTQRVPDKRVIIKDLQLLGLVTALVIADVILLVTWVLSDPIQCLQILSVTGRDVTCSLTKTHFCSSLYSDVWIALFWGCKGLLLLYGTYLAGLTDHVSSPPVNQSLTIMVGVNLVVLAAGLLFVVTRYLHSWPNLVFGLTSGGIFVCTTTINCFVFIPQLKQWKAFEEENQTIRRMAKYFSTPCKSFHTQCGDEQNYHPRGDKNSMERLLTEKNAVIENLQEQVNNAKEKLVRLMSSEGPCAPPEWAVARASSPSTGIQAAASGHSMTAQGPSGGLSDSQNDSSPAAQDCQSTSVPSSSIQSLKGPVKEDLSPSPGQKEKSSDLKDFSDHLNLGCSQKPRVEQSGCPEGGSQVPIVPSLNLIPGEVSALHRQRQPENSEEPQERLSRVNTVIRKKLQEVLQDLSLGPETPLPFSSSCPQQLFKSSAAPLPQKMAFPKELGFSPYMVRRRKAVLQAPSHFLGSVTSNVWRQANRTVSEAQSRLSGPNVDNHSMTHRTLHPRVPRPTSRKPLLPLPDPHNRAGNLESSNQCQTERQRARGSHGVRLSSPHLLTTSPDLPEQQQLQPPKSPAYPSLSSPCSYLDTDSSSSDEFFCRCHRPYCEICFQSSSNSSDSGTSDTDPEPAAGQASWEKLWARSKPIVNFKDDLKPTLV
ncbi:PREDICTED: probable G-protein coupled receptor 156 isoform X2 [Chrysochloris asiatica]|uniref:Probable G-protein coupled receptor 156 isoform X2 n=1 Tax=Chrysochloris asiatica TaxID=185453 RepID=A0A9B0TKI1_CHRAS|nr:PREDICTED: probable G-protein coupled receptor 156 isoform X2 [Chrysochloris asiatica]